MFTHANISASRSGDNGIVKEHIRFVVKVDDEEIVVLITLEDWQRFIDGGSRLLQGKTTYAARVSGQSPSNR